MNAISKAAAILDDIASGTLCHADFYSDMEDAGIHASNLCSLVISDPIYSEEESAEKAILDAAECLKDICICSDLVKWAKAMHSAKMHSDRLYSIVDSMQ